MRNSVVIDTVGGQAFIGGVSIAVQEAGKRGELHVGGSAGPILRPITFGERIRLVTRAAASPAALDTVCAGVLQAATVQPGRADRFVQEILALTLAGADQEAPGFAETILLVAQAARWELSQLYEAEAAEVDRLAVALVGRPSDSGWTRIIFARSEETLESIRRELAEQLLQRGDPVVGATALERAPAAMLMSPPVQTLSRFNVDQARLSEEQASQPFGIGQATPAQRDLPFPPQSAEPSSAGNPIADANAAKAPYVRLRVPALTFEKSAARRSTRGVSAHDGQTDMSTLRWSLLPSSGNRGSAVPEATLKRGNSPLAQSGSAATTTVEALAPRPDSLPRARFRANDELSASSRASAQLLQQAAEETLHTSGAAVTMNTGVQSVMRARDKSGPVEPSAALSGMQPLFTDWSEAADALAALLDHEADLRGIE
jgi:hypothetical protein